MSLLAVDIGSSACKAAVFASSGEILAQHSSHYAPEFPRPSYAEMHPDKFWDAVCISCRAAMIWQILSAPLCLSSHGETLWRSIRVAGLASAILNQDNRAVQESAWCEETIGRQRLFQITGLFAHPMYPIPKILWLRNHEPEVFHSASSFLTLIGYLLQKIGLPPYVDYSLASRFLGFDILELSWSDEILGAATLDKARLPVPVPAGTIAGKLSSAAASQLGLSAGIPVVLGGHDQPWRTGHRRD
jgi:xylulokinase